MKKILLLMTLLVVPFLSCTPDDPAVEGGSQLDDVVTNQATNVTPFSVTLNGAINNFKSSEINKGQFGFLYLISTDIDMTAAELIFKDYAASGSSSDCKKRYAVNLLSGNVFSIEIKDLSPESTIYYCALFEKADGEIIIGEGQIVNSLEFAPKFKLAEAKDVRLLHTIVTMDVDLCGASGKECSLGLCYSETEDDLVSGNAVNIQYKKQLSGNVFDIDITPLKANTTYYARPYLYFKSTKEYFYGDIISFTTLNPEIIEVDMGLSVKWSSLDLGADDPLGEAWYFTYLSLNPVKFDDKLYGTGYYESYMSSEEFNSICPHDIAGTEFDPATYYLGEKWRMPTLAEVRELIENTVVELKQKDDFDELELEHSVIWSKKIKDAHFKMNSYKTLTSNENLLVRSYNRWWTSTTLEYDSSYEWYRLPYIFEVSDQFYYSDMLPYIECSIRPVCEY